MAEYQVAQLGVKWGFRCVCVCVCGLSVCVRVGGGLMVAMEATHMAKPFSSAWSQGGRQG